MFRLHLEEDGTAISTGNLPSDPAYNPIFLLLDSTSQSPDPSSPVGCLLSLPAGRYSEEARVFFEGTTANNWEITAVDPASVTDETLAGWGKDILVSVSDNVSTPFWVRSRTVFGEVPTDDRSVRLRATGLVRKT